MPRTEMTAQIAAAVASVEDCPAQRGRPTPLISRKTRTSDHEGALS